MNNCTLCLLSNRVRSDRSFSTHLSYCAPWRSARTATGDITGCSRGVAVSLWKEWRAVKVHTTLTAFFHSYTCFPVLLPKLTFPLRAHSGYEEVEKERKRQVIRVKEEPLEEEKKPVVCGPEQSADGDTTTLQNQRDKDSLNLFLQKPSSFSKLSKLLEVAKTAEDSGSASPNVYSAASHPSYSISQAATSQQGLTDKTEGLVPSRLKTSPWMTCSPQPIVQDDQLSKITEKSNQWFSLFPRSPCDGSSVTTGSSPPASSPPPQTVIPKSSCSPLSSNPPAASDSGVPPGILDMQSFVLQVGG